MIQINFANTIPTVIPKRNVAESNKTPIFLTLVCNIVKIYSSYYIKIF